MSDSGAPEIPEAAFSFSFVRAGGAGGQHVNKVAPAVQMKVHLSRIDLPQSVKARLRKLAGSRLTGADEITLFADRFRSQLRNKEDALERWQEMLEKALVPPKRRVATRPTRAQKRARMDRKKKQGNTKKLRGRPSPQD